MSRSRVVHGVAVMNRVSMRVRPPSKGGRPHTSVRDATRTISSRGSPIVKQGTRQPRRRTQYRAHVRFRHQKRGQRRHNRRHATPIKFTLPMVPMVVITVEIIIQVTFIPTSTPYQRRASHPPYGLRQSKVMIRSIKIRGSIRAHTRTSIMMIMTNVISTRHLRIKQGPTTITRLSLNTMTSTSFITMKRTLQKLPFIKDLNHPTSTARGHRRCHGDYFFRGT